MVVLIEHTDVLTSPYIPGFPNFWREGGKVLLMVTQAFLIRELLLLDPTSRVWLRASTDIPGLASG